jgi:hypothetical protein
MCRVSARRSSPNSPIWSRCECSGVGPTRPAAGAGCGRHLDRSARRRRRATLGTGRGRCRHHGGCHRRRPGRRIAAGTSGRERRAGVSARRGGRRSGAGGNGAGRAGR